MTRPKQLQHQQQQQLLMQNNHRQQHQHHQQQHHQHHRQFELQLLLLLLGLLQLLPAIAALPQQQLLLDGTQVVDQTAATAPALNDPSDLSAGLNLFPVSNLIAAAANAEPPAPVQFVRIAMNSGL